MSGRATEKIHTYYEQKSINDPRNNDPFPELVLLDESVHFRKGLDCYDNFFEQILNLDK